MLLTDATLRGDQLLAHWVEREYTKYRERNRALITFMGVMIVAVALFFLIFIEDGGLETAGFLFFVLIIFFIVSKVTPGLERNRALHASHDTFITRKSGLYPFRSFLMQRDGVTFHEATKRYPSLLVFSFLQIFRRFIVNPFEISVPVPEGQEEQAREIATKISE